MDLMSIQRQSGVSGKIRLGQEKQQKLIWVKIHCLSMSIYIFIVCFSKICKNSTKLIESAFTGGQAPV